MVMTIRVMSSGKGYEYLTFSPPKSVSAIWGVADAGTHALIAQAHHAAMRDTIALPAPSDGRSLCVVHGSNRSPEDHGLRFETCRRSRPR